MTHDDRYYTDLATAFVLGRARDGTVPGLPVELAARQHGLTANERERVVAVGIAAGLRLHRFKRTASLPRVRRVLGILKNLDPTSLLDIGSGRGVFLWPLLDAFPDLAVTAIDRDPGRITTLLTVRQGGLNRLTAEVADVTRMPLADAAFDVVTFLEVLEHIPDAPQALAEAVRVAARFVILSVPSKPDSNPEHIHLFSEAAVRDMFVAAGAASVNVSYVRNHLIAVARVGDR